MTTPTHAPLTKIAAACAVQYMHQGITIVLMPHSPEMIGRRDGKVKRSNKVTAVPNNQPEGKKKKWGLNKKLFYSMTLLCPIAPPHCSTALLHRIVMKCQDIFVFNNLLSRTFQRAPLECVLCNRKFVKNTQIHGL